MGKTTNGKRNYNIAYSARNLLYSRYVLIQGKEPAKKYNICKQPAFTKFQITAKRFNNESEKPDTSCF
jgi:hypothetical protein